MLGAKYYSQKHTHNLQNYDRVLLRQTAQSYKPMDYFTNLLQYQPSSFSYLIVIVGIRTQAAFPLW